MFSAKLFKTVSLSNSVSHSTDLVEGLQFTQLSISCHHKISGPIRSDMQIIRINVTDS